MTQGAMLQPTTLGDLALSNRVVMAPLTRSRSSSQGVPPPFAADYYGQRADAGLIVSEATNVSPQAVGYAYTPGIWNDEQAERWASVTARVHDRGGRIFLQLWHTGRISHPDLQGGALPVAPSAIRPTGTAFTEAGMQEHVTPRALETDEIGAIIDDYRNAARRARQAGFDGVEIHSANNYLLEQFVRDSTNRRTDQFGGSVENRLRFPLAVVEAVTDVWGGGQRVGIRLSPATTQPGETPLDSEVGDTFNRYVDALNRFGLVYLHTIEGVTQQTRDAPDGVDFPALRQRFGGAYIGNNNYTLAMADDAVARGEVDLVSFGRSFLANPDLIERMRTGAPLADAPKQYWYGGGTVGYTDWPTMTGQATVP